ncbi:MAG: cation transporter [Syntrophaceae bacterium]|nr:cation transporter [Syntrophaceae bacterium]
MKIKPLSSREKDIRSITLWGAVLNAALMILKIIVGLFVRSSALIADGIHSLSDLGTDFIVLVSSRLSNRPPDETHPFGHGKFETLASQLIASILVGVGFLFVWTAGLAIYRREVNYPGFSVLVIAALSIVSKEILFALTRKVARRTHSTSLYANAWHHRSDAFSSVAVLLGGAASLIGWGYADNMATIVVGIMIMAVGGKFFYDNLIELTEHAADKKTIQVLKSILSDEIEIKSWHALRTRNIGGELFIDVHVCVDAGLTVLESHKICDKIETNIRREISKPVNILIHTDPYEADRPESSGTSKS